MPSRVRITFTQPGGPVWIGGQAVRTAIAYAQDSWGGRNYENWAKTTAGQSVLARMLAMAKKGGIQGKLHFFRERRGVKLRESRFLDFILAKGYKKRVWKPAPEPPAYAPIAGNAKPAVAKVDWARVNQNLHLAEAGLPRQPRVPPPARANQKQPKPFEPGPIRIGIFK